MSVPPLDRSRIRAVSCCGPRGVSLVAAFAAASAPTTMLVFVRVVLSLKAPPTNERCELMCALKPDQTAFTTALTTSKISKSYQSQAAPLVQ